MKTQYDIEQEAVKAAVARHSGTFGLRAFPGGIFRVSSRASYWSEVNGGGVLLYTQKLRGLEDGYKEPTWVDFAKGTEAELVAQKCKAPGTGYCADRAAKPEDLVRNCKPCNGTGWGWSSQRCSECSGTGVSK